jgi:hypothetical protein
MTIWREITKLTFSEKPDYRKLIVLLKTIIADLNVTGTHEFDWENMKRDRLEAISEISLEMVDDTETWLVEENEVKWMCLCRVKTKITGM